MSNHHTIYVIHIYLMTGMQLYENTEVKKRVANAKPYGKWFSEGSRALEAASYSASSSLTIEALFKQHQYVCLSVQFFACDIAIKYILYLLNKDKSLQLFSSRRWLRREMRFYRFWTESCIAMLATTLILSKQCFSLSVPTVGVLVTLRRMCKWS